MKRVKIIATALFVFAVVGSGLAFKARFHAPDRYIISGGKCILACNSTDLGFGACPVQAFTTKVSDTQCSGPVAAFQNDGQ